VALLATSVGLAAQTSTKRQPALGQPGKDVIWLPTPQVLVDKMLDMASVTAKDVVMDLGSGDGIVVITAAKRGARAIGVEYNTELVELSRRNAAAQGVSDKATFIRADLFQTDLSTASVITLFLREDLNLKLRPRLLQLRPGTRVVSNTFDMGEWEPDDLIVLQRNCARWCSALMWIVPVQVQGAWRMPQGEMTLAQSFQMVTGTLRTGPTSAPVRAGKLRGDQISFTAGQAQFSGRVRGNTIEGTVTTARGAGKWTATRQSGR
jgi:hypothetical protein